MTPLTTRQKVIVAVVYTATAVAVGRWSLPAKVKTEIKTVTVEKQILVKDTTKAVDTNKKTIVKETVKPNGEKVIVTITTDNSKEKSNTEAKTVTDLNKTGDTTKAIIRPQDRVTLSMLGGYDLMHSQFVYGASVTKPIIGPIAIGAWFLNNGTVGASLGLTF